MQNISDNFAITPNGNSKKYISSIKKIIKKFNINLLIPGSDEEALKHQKMQIILKKCIIAIVDFKTLNIFSDKIRTYQALKKFTLSRV